MAKLRRAACYRRIKRAYTRVSKYREQSYVKGVPGPKITKFDTGVSNGVFTHKIELVARSNIQVRHNALEAARIAANRHLEKSAGKDNYHLKIKLYPHQIMRWAPKANFAGADRFQKGMKDCYGKPLGRAAVVKDGKVIMFARVNEGQVKNAKEALKKAAIKLPCKHSIVVGKAVGAK